jgi:hypothetical protein
MVKKTDTKKKAGKGKKPKEIKEWLFYMNTTIPKDGNKEDSRLVAAFDKIRGGITQEGKPYLFLSGFSKELGSGVSINLGYNIDKLLMAMEDAGFLGGPEDTEETSEEVEGDDEEEEEEDDEDA